MSLIPYHGILDVPRLLKDLAVFHYIQLALAYEDASPRMRWTIDAVVSIGFALLLIGAFHGASQ